MPQFDPTFFPSQLFWLLITFLSLYWVIARFAIPRIRDILEQRENTIQDDLDRAERLKTEIDDAICAYEAALSNARSQAGDTLKLAAENVKELIDTRQASISDAIAEQIKDGEDRIAAAKAEAMDGLQTIAAEAAREAALRLAELEVDKKTVNEAVLAAIRNAR